MVAQWQRIRVLVQETHAESLGWEDHLEKEATTHSSILGWEFSWTQKPS